MKIRNTVRVCHAIQAADWCGPRWFDVPPLAKEVEVPTRFQASPALARLLASGALERVDGDAPSRNSSPPAEPAAEPSLTGGVVAGSPEDDLPESHENEAPSPARSSRRRSFARSLASLPSSDGSDD